MASRLCNPNHHFTLTGMFVVALAACPSLALAADYTYDAKFEPPTGRIVHGMGPHFDGNADYLEALSDPAILPASSESFFALGNTSRPWPEFLQKLTFFLEQERAAGRIPRLGMSLNTEGNAVTVPLDNEVVAGLYDQRLDDLGQLLAAYGYPVFLRIGFEFNGDWNGYTPYIYPKAFQHVVDYGLRANGAENVATSWCYEPAADDDFGEVNADGEYKWYPGKAYVDWACVDVFVPNDFYDPSGGNHVPLAYQHTTAFLEFAAAQGLGVSIDESAASVGITITPDVADGMADWAAWFVPYFAFLKSNSIIKIFHYMNADKYSSPDWTSGNIANNPAYIVPKYKEEMANPAYLHAGAENLKLLRWYTAYAPGVKPYGVETPSCMGSAQAGVIGAAQAGNTTFAITVDGAPPSTKGFLVISSASQTQGLTIKSAKLFVELGLGSQVTWLSITTDANGHAQLVIPLTEEQVGTTGYAQFAFPNTACGAPKTWSASQALEITVQP